MINDAIEYIPRKTKEGKPFIVRVPLNSIAKEILEKYKEEQKCVSRDPRMSEVLSVVPRTIERELSSMQKAGVIRHEGKTSGGKWVVLIALE